MQGYTDVVQLLLEAGLDPNERTNWQADERGEPTPFMPLFDAVLHEKIETVQILLTFGADPNLPSLPDSRVSHTALQLAELHGSVELVGLLRSAFAISE